MMKNSLIKFEKQELAQILLFSNYGLNPISL
jgi:hypothetical protein